MLTTFKAYNLSDLVKERPSEEALNKVYGEFRASYDKDLKRAINNLVVPALKRKETPRVTSFVSLVAKPLKDLWLKALQIGQADAAAEPISLQYLKVDSLASFARGDDKTNEKRAKNSTENILSKRIQKEVGRDYRKIEFDTYLNKRIVKLGRNINEEVSSVLKDKVAYYLNNRYNNLDPNRDLVDYLTSALPSRITELENLLTRYGLPTDLDIFRGVFIDSVLLDGYPNSAKNRAALEAFSRENPKLINRYKSVGALEGGGSEQKENLRKYGSSLYAVRKLLQEYNSLNSKYGGKGRAYAYSQQSRVRKIALTEISAAYNLGRLQAYINSGVKKVRWEVVEEGLYPCAYCSSKRNNVYFINDLLSQDYSNNDIKSPVLDLIPAHPHCKCYWRAVYDNENISVTPVNKAKRYATTVLSAGAGILSIAFLYRRFKQGLSASDKSLARQLEKEVRERVGEEFVNKSMEEIGKEIITRLPEDLVPIDTRQEELDKQTDEIKQLNEEINNEMNSILSREDTLYPEENTSSLLLINNRRLVAQVDELYNELANTYALANTTLDTTNYNALVDRLEQLSNDLRAGTLSEDAAKQLRDEIYANYYNSLAASNTLSTLPSQVDDLQRKLIVARNEVVGLGGLEYRRNSALRNKVNRAKYLSNPANLDEVGMLDDALLRLNDLLEGSEAGRINTYLDNLNISNNAYSTLRDQTESIFRRTLVNQPRLLKDLDEAYRALTRSAFYNKTTYNKQEQFLANIETRLDSLLNSKGGLSKLDYESFMIQLKNSEKTLRSPERFKYIGKELSTLRTINSEIDSLISNPYISEASLAKLSSRSSKLDTLEQFIRDRDRLISEHSRIFSRIENAPKISPTRINEIKRQLARLNKVKNKTPEQLATINSLQEELSRIDELQYMAFLNVAKFAHLGTTIHGRKNESTGIYTQRKGSKFLLKK